MEKKKIDWKFVIGTILLVAILVGIGSAFWRMVGEQAVLVKKEEARQEAEAIPAIYVYVGEGFKRGVFVDTRTSQVFTAQIPKEGIYNKAGTLIAGDVLEDGDLVKIYGDNKFSEDGLAEYNGVTKMQRTGRASLEQAETYRKAASESQIQEEE